MLGSSFKQVALSMQVVLNMETKIDNPSIKIYLNKIKIWIIFKIKTRYYLELLTSETMKLLGSTENKIPHLEITKVVLVHFNIVNNDYQQHSRGLYTFVLNKSFSRPLEISPTSFIFLKTFNS